MHSMPIYTFFFIKLTIGIYMYYPQEQHQIDHSHIPLNEEALIIQSNLVIRSTDQSFRDVILSTNFPLVLTQKP